MTAEAKVVDKTERGHDMELEWTVFLVDDDCDDLKLAERVLKESPYIRDVRCISDSGDLFRELYLWHTMGENSENPPKSLIILDIHMPGIDGISLLTQLRSNPHTEKIPVMILTGDGGSDKVERTFYMQANGFIVKPLGKDNLDHLHRVLEKGKNWEPL